MKLMNILRKASLNESPRIMRLIWGEMGQPATSKLDYDKRHQQRMQAIDKAINMHYKGVAEKDILMYVANSKEDRTRIKNAVQKSGVTGIWADDDTFLFVSKQ